MKQVQKDKLKYLSICSLRIILSMILFPFVLLGRLVEDLFDYCDSKLPKIPIDKGKWR